MKKGVDNLINENYIMSISSQLVRNGGETKMKMSEIIRKHIQENGYIKNVIADKCKMDHQKFYRILSGNKNMTIEEYELICREGFGLDPSYFFKKKFSESEKNKSA